MARSSRWRRPTGLVAADVDAAPGTPYMFALDDGEPRTDPRALSLPEGPEGPSQVIDRSQLAIETVPWRGVHLPGAVIYELHVGTFTAEGTLDAAIGRLDHLVELGVDIVEVMPLATFPGRHGWGYDGVGLYAVHEPYGGPHAFRRFVDACHARGLGVCLDVVYNHLGPSGNHLRGVRALLHGPLRHAVGRRAQPRRRRQRRGAPLHHRQRGHVAARLPRRRATARRRPRAVRRPGDHVPGGAVGGGERLVDPAGPAAVADRGVRPQRPAHRDPREAGGLGLNAQWADDVHHALHVLLTGETLATTPTSRRRAHSTKVLEGIFLHDGTYSTFRQRTHGRRVDRAKLPGSRFVVSLQTHDQVGNRAQGDRLSALVSPGLLACGAALLLTSAGTPMLFMGEEWGAATPWQYFTDHTEPAIAAAVRRGRRDEFAEHGWDRSDVPDPQSGTDRGALTAGLGGAPAGAAQPAVLVVPRPDQAASRAR